MPTDTVLLFPVNKSPSDEGFYDNYQEWVRLLNKHGAMNARRLFKTTHTSDNFLGKHTWRNVNDGSEVVSDGVWIPPKGDKGILTPHIEDENELFLSWCGMGCADKGRNFIEFYVLVDDITEEQRADWESHRKLKEAQRKARENNGGHEVANVQIALF